MEEVWTLLKPTRRRLLWLPSNAPDLCERRLRDRLTRFQPLVCRTGQQALDSARGQRNDRSAGQRPVRRPGNRLTLFWRPFRPNAPDASVLPAGLETAGLQGSGTWAGRAPPASSDRRTTTTAVAAELETALGRESGAPERWRRNLVGESAAMQRLCSLVQMVSQRRGTVLLRGETGTGKEVLAQAIHDAGKRAAQPFVAVNCSAIPGTLLESELFGHTRGAFTGAQTQRAGRFEQAQNGTIFLDEIGDLDLELQSKLLRVLQEREMQRLGSSETVRLDVRVIAATHVDLACESTRRGFPGRPLLPTERYSDRSPAVAFEKGTFRCWPNTSCGRSVRSKKFPRESSQEAP